MEIIRFEKHSAIGFSETECFQIGKQNRHEKFINKIRWKQIFSFN